MIGSARTPRPASKCSSTMVHVSAPRPLGGATRRQGNADLRSAPPAGGGREAQCCFHPWRRGGQGSPRRFAEYGIAPSGHRATLRSRSCEPRCRPEVGVPGRPRTSCSGGSTRFGGPAGRGADRRSAFQAVPALLLGRQYAVSRPCGTRCRSAGPQPRSPRWLAEGRPRGSLRARPRRERGSAGTGC